MNFNATYQGKVYALAGGILYSFSDGVLKGVQVSANIDDNTYVNRHQVALTGYYVISKSGNVGWQTTSGEYIIMNEGWEYMGVVPIMKYSQKQAQALVNKIIKNNKIIIQNNLLCARYANKLTEDQKADVRQLQYRLQARDKALQAGQLTTDIQTSYPAGYAELSAYLDALMLGESIGIATWAVVVIACTVIAATATAAYFAYKSYADESEKDVKFSKELTSILTSKLTEEEYQQLLAETKGIVTKARIKQSISSYGNILWIAAIGVGGVLLYRWLQTKMRKEE